MSSSHKAQNQLKMDIYRKLIEELIRRNASTTNEALKIRQELCRLYKPKIMPSLIQTMLRADKNEISKLSFLKTKPMRTASGVAPVAVMTKPAKCPHGKCTICPGGPKSEFGTVPQSYTGEEPAARRAARNNYDPYLQVFNRLEQYALLNQTAQKIEMIIMGGTFPARPKSYQEKFVAYSLKAMNDFSRFYDKKGFGIDKFRKHFLLPCEVNDEKRFRQVQKNTLKLKGKAELKKEQAKNEKAMHRCVAMCVETRPDYCTEKEIDEMLKLGVTRVELGVQSVSDKVLERINRKHTVQDSVKATQLLKDSFLKVGYHISPGLPDSTPEKDVEMFKILFENKDFKPDALKIYPCMVLKGTKLYDEYKSGKYKPLNTEEAARIIAAGKRYIPEYCWVMRVQRDIPTKMTEAGVGLTNLRQGIKAECRCIRCREPRGGKIDLNKLRIKTAIYEASGGKEAFIAAEAEDKLIGFCRLRKPHKPYRKEITPNSTGIRELHVYSQAMSLGEKADESMQHKGIGKMLMREAEKTAKERFRADKMLVIAGIGVKQYYKSLGYRKDGPYMSKSF